MSQSLSKLFVHIVYHIKTTSVKIRNQDRKDLYAYIGSIIKNNECIPIIINGTENHIHILCVMSKNISLVKLVEDIKCQSSRWIKTFNPYYKKFAWQGGYGGFSVSSSLHDKTKNYIKNQDEHHKKRTFQEEYQMFLNEYDIEFDERYIWRD
ncbi:transposase [Odoribacter sp. OttesenSCG-928-L07]|nr:transposase [Odoribacter sp. OttesenSCG-928-L07]MDL2238617.1 transposase [Bacteroidales bacterium OttesenSCG-928-L14]MDL2240505.1 transposase [Bacteroidales bacterium OttesenSCG-928-K22]